LRTLAGQLLPEFDPRAVPKQWFDPTNTDTPLNSISRASSDYRNCYMVPMLAAAARHGKRVFVVVGGSHVIMQEPALRSLLP
jgi:hypothetical protein